jgi:pimeloyl-ACP methyl ester carboxylesterase
MSDEVDLDRRRFIRQAALTVAAAELAACTDSLAPRRTFASNSFRPSTRFTTIKQIHAGLLDVGYAELGPASGPPVFLLHGWPYDIHSFVDVAPMLASIGYRVIVPHLRGHGTTRFLSASAFRNGQQAAIALDIIALMDALQIDKPILAGFDWGARTATIIAALWPERCKAIVAGNGYLINNLDRNKLPAPPRTEWAWWYQYYFATERGRAGLEANRRELAKLIWRTNSPSWVFDNATFDRSAASFDNSDYVSVVIHNYRWRLSIESGDGTYDEVEQRLASSPSILVPALTLDGDADGVTPASNAPAYAARFTSRHSHWIVRGAGHNLPQESPQLFADAIVEVDSY